MGISVRVKGGRKGREVEVTSSGELVTAPLHYSETVHKELAVDATAYNFYGPKPGKQFVITGLIYNADQQVSNTAGAEVIIYEAGTVDTTTVDKVLHQDDMIRNDRVVAVPLYILVNGGKWINAKTSDDDVHMTIMGYYIDALG